MAFEKTQKGNPHNLTLNQHVFPCASIARFANVMGKVAAFHILTNKNIEITPDNSLFCAKRVWDQRAEQGYMKQIEDDFQRLADAVLTKRIGTIGPQETLIVNDFFALWNVRAHRKANPISDQRINGIVSLERNLTKGEQELLEKNHISFIRPDLTIPGRIAVEASKEYYFARDLAACPR